MRAVALFLSVCLLVAYATPDSGVAAQDKKDPPKDKAKEKPKEKEKDKGKPDFAKLLVGKWEGTGTVEGFILEFKDGKITETDTKSKDAKPQSGPYTLKDKTITSTLGKSKQDQEIISLDEKELKFKRIDGVELTYKRKK